MNDRHTLSTLLAQGRVEEFLRLSSLSADLPSDIQAEQRKWQRVVQRLECILEDANGWQSLKRKQKQVRVRTRRGRDSFEFSMQAEIAAAGTAVIAIMNEPKRYAEIIPFCNSSEVVKTVSPYQQEVMIQSKVPFLDLRFLKVRIAKITSQAPGKTVIYIEGVPLKESKAFQGSQIKLNTLIIRLNQEKQGVISLSVYALLDEALSYIPSMLVNKILQLGVTQFLQQVRTLARPSL